MRPYIICHMLSSIDGKIDGASLKPVTKDGEYEATGSLLQGDAWICGRTTMQQHFAAAEPFRSQANKSAGPRPAYIARHAASYAISVDTLGKLSWAASDIDGDHLICIVSEQVAEDYLSMLEERGISYIVSGANSVDLRRAVDLLGEHFAIKRLLLEGGGHINGAFLEAGLVDEISLLIVPGVDGRHQIPAVFDGIDPARATAFALKLKSVQQRDHDALWIRYEVIQS